MRTTAKLDDVLLERAQKLSGLGALLREALEALIQAHRSLRAR